MMKDIEPYIQQLEHVSQNVTAKDKAFLVRILSDESKDDEQFPLVDIPQGLGEKLYAIADDSKNTKNRKKLNVVLQALVSLAAMVIIGLFLIEKFQQPSEKEIQRAKQELVIAFNYLNAANQKTNLKVKQTLNARLQQASVKTVFNIVPPKKHNEVKSISEEKL
ncbi:hypothetical protein [Agarilytica rhodophyticola]|uniref:hypothetical protein n=1 Tax=Agarilytica rhodophyticola TaxID=1737490 RepID=UPI000B344D9B|nr:hypothetical protein [Agarilytica rhodophyticola]